MARQNLTRRTPAGARPPQSLKWAGGTAIAAISLLLVSATASASPDSKPYHRGDGEFAEKIFEKLDTDKDGSLSREEVTNAREARMQGIDKDKDGFISADELTAHRAERYAERQERHHERFVEHFDKDGDGRVSVEEMKAYQSGRFARADRNNDGNVSREEWQAARQHHHRMKYGDTHYPDKD